jgi:hypothetical protein
MRSIFTDLAYVIFFVVLGWTLWSTMPVVGDISYVLACVMFYTLIEHWRNPHA